MKSNGSLLLGLVVGAVAGAVPTYIFMKRKLDSVVADFNEYLEYGDITDEYDQEDKDYVYDPDPVDEVNPRYDDDEVKEKLERNYEETTNYASLYAAMNQGTAANFEHPVDSDEDEFEEDAEAAQEATEDHNKNKHKNPKIISEEAVGDLPSYVDHEVLLYYQNDDTLTTENDMEIPDPETYIGDALTKYGFDENEEERIYVMNYALDTCYEVQKFFKPFEARRKNQQFI